MTKVFLGADHRGFALKKKILQHLGKQAYEVEDMGTDSENRCDYPVFAEKVGEAVAKNEDSFGIVICGSGQGVCIAANKVKGVRCGFANSMELAELGRAHPGANVLALGATAKNYNDPLDIVETFLKGEVDPAERHQTRRDMLDDM